MMFDFNVYKEKAMRTVNKELTDRERLGNAIMGLNGEIGEITDVVKKYLYQGHDLDWDNLHEELGDVMWYVALLCDVMGFDMDDVLKGNLDKLSARYKDGFSKEESINREV